MFRKRIKKKSIIKMRRNFWASRRDNRFKKSRGQRTRRRLRGNIDRFKLFYVVGLRDCTAETPFDWLRARSKKFLIKKFSELCELRNSYLCKFARLRQIFEEPKTLGWDIPPAKAQEKYDPKFPKNFASCCLCGRYSENSVAALPRRAFAVNTLKFLSAPKFLAAFSRCF